MQTFCNRRNKSLLLIQKLQRLAGQTGVGTSCRMEREACFSQQKQRSLVRTKLRARQRSRRNRAVSEPSAPENPHVIPGRARNP